MSPMYYLAEESIVILTDEWCWLVRIGILGHGANDGNGEDNYGNLHDSWC